MDALEQQLALAQVPSLTARQLRTAIEHLGPSATGPSPLSALIGQPQRRLESAGLSGECSATLHAPDRTRIDRERAWVERQHVAVLDVFCSDYPLLLAQIADAPPLLFVRGDPGCLRLPQLAVVGSRGPTTEGRRTARHFAEYLARAGLLITSGLALGVDAAAHEGALLAGRTVAVLGSGLDHIYPPQHAPLAERIAERGALVSEFAPGCPPLKRHFPRRNRLISGLALGTLVVEAARYSGSLITARLAAEQGREVFAIPGSIHNQLARGCHALIRSGAKLVESIPDVLEELRFFQSAQGLIESPGDHAAAPVPGNALDNEYEILLDALGFGPSRIDELVERSGLSSQSVASMLLILELDGRVALQTDGRYQRLTA